jgi:hypothetical protein
MTNTRYLTVPNPQYLTVPELASRLRMSPGTLANWRHRGEGPGFLKIGKKILYPIAEVQAYEEQALRRSVVGSDQ